LILPVISAGRVGCSKKREKRKEKKEDKKSQKKTKKAKSLFLD